VLERDPPSRQLARRPTAHPVVRPA
jgi:hypothetical protein